MSTSLRISIPTERDFYSDETKKALKKLIKEIEPHNKNVVLHIEAQAKIKNSKTEELSVEEVFDGAASVRFRYALYKRSIELCDLVHEFSKLHQADRNAEKKRISDQIDAKRKEVREQLTEIGYGADKIHRNHLQQVELFSMMHPVVMELRQLMTNLSGFDQLTGGDRKALLFEMERLMISETRVA